MLRDCCGPVLLWIWAMRISPVCAKAAAAETARAARAARAGRWWWHMGDVLSCRCPAVCLMFARVRTRHMQGFPAIHRDGRSLSHPVFGGWRAALVALPGTRHRPSPPAAPGVLRDIHWRRLRIGTFISCG